MVLWAWQPMRLAFQVAGFQTQSIHLLPTVVAIRWQLSPQAKWKEEWLWVPTLAGTCKKRVVFFFFFWLFQLVYFQGNWAGYSEAAVFTQCHCFLKGCPLPKPPSLCWEGSWPLSHPAAITWLASTSLLLGYHFQGFMFWWLTHRRERYEMHK